MSNQDGQLELLPIVSGGRKKLHVQSTLEHWAPFYAKASLCNHFDDDCRRAVAELFSDTQTLPPRSTFLSEYEEAERISLLCEGWAAREVYMADGKVSLTELFLPGDMFPIRSAMSGTTTGDRIVALSQCAFSTCKPKELEQAAIQCANFARTLWWLAQRDISILRTWIAFNGQQVANVRMAHLFCELHFRLGQAGLGVESRYSFPVTQEALGSLIGVTAVHVNRTLQVFRADGLVDFSHGEVTLFDVERLWDAASFDPEYLISH